MDDEEDKFIQCLLCGKAAKLLTSSSSLFQPLSTNSSHRSSTQAGTGPAPACPTAHLQQPQLICSSHTPICSTTCTRRRLPLSHCLGTVLRQDLRRMGVALQSSSTRLVNLIHLSDTRVDLKSKRESERTLSQQASASAWTLDAEYRVPSK